MLAEGGERQLSLEMVSRAVRPASRKGRFRGALEKNTRKGNDREGGKKRRKENQKRLSNPYEHISSEKRREVPVKSGEQSPP